MHLLIAAHSPFLRIALERLLQTSRRNARISRCHDGESCLERIVQQPPRMVLLALPEAQLLPTLRAILSCHRCPVILLTPRRLPHLAIQGLAAGAVDFIPWDDSPGGLDVEGLALALARQLDYWPHHSLSPTEEPAPPPPRRPAPGPSRPDLLLVGGGSGGLPAFNTLLQALGTPPCPLLLALKLPPGYTTPLVQALAQRHHLPVREAHHQERLQPATVVVVPSSSHCEVVAGPEGLRLAVREPSLAGPRVTLDRLFHAAAHNARAPLGILLSSRSEDGLAGARELAATGHPVLVQQPESCFAPELPRAVLQAGLSHSALPPGALGALLRRLT